MKKLILAILLFATPAFGAYLVCDAPPPCSESGQLACPVSATIYMDAVIIAEGIELQPDLSILYDIGEMPVGEHVYTATYKDDLGRESVPSDPYILLEVVGAPINTRMEP